MSPDPKRTAGGAVQTRDRLGVDVCRDLARSPRQLNPKYLYDELGSALFDAICALPWYPVTRAEKALLLGHRDRIAGAVARPARAVELGCGTGEKLRILVEAFVARGRQLAVDLIDISAAALDRSALAIGGLRGMSVRSHEGTYEDGLQEMAGARAGSEHWLIMFLGSNIGNFDPPAAFAFLELTRRLLEPGDLLLLGVDLVKPRREMLEAYDDPLGVTAAFNRNLLVRLNRELGADFDVEAFRHRALWNEQERRVEMHLVSCRPQFVRIPGAGCEIRFDRDEIIWTESSYKYEPDQVQALTVMAGFDERGLWIEQAGRFLLALVEAGR